MGEIEIAKNLRMVEELQCEMLQLVSELFFTMKGNRISGKEQSELLANLQITGYLLAEKLGISNQALDQKMISRLKLGMAQEEGSQEWKDALRGLLYHMGKK